MSTADDAEPGDELTTPQAAEIIGVSLDTIRAMIRDEKLPARRRRPGGPYVLARHDVVRARDERTAGLRAGPRLLTEDDRARLREARDRETRAEGELEKAFEARAELVISLARQLRGTGAMAEALGVDRSTVQEILRTGDVPVVHHRRATELTGDEVEQLRAAQEAVARARDGVDTARTAREAATRAVLERGGYGLASEVAHELGRHRSRLLTKRGRRRSS